MFGDVDRLICLTGPGRQRNTPGVEFFREVDVLYCPMGSVHLPVADVELECQLAEIRGGEERVERKNLIFDPDLPLTFGHIADHPELWILFVDSLIGEDRWQSLSSETAASSKDPKRSVIALSVYSRTHLENSICQGSPCQASGLPDTSRLYIAPPILRSLVPYDAASFSPLRSASTMKRARS